MKKIAVMLLAVSGLILFSCKKEKATPTINPTGYWKGNAFVYYTAIVNKENGASRLYLRIYGDTSNTSVKMDGQYQFQNNRLKAVYKSNGDSVVLESNSMSATEMSGVLFFPGTAEAIQFSFRKQ